MIAAALGFLGGWKWVLLAVVAGAALYWTHIRLVIKNDRLEAANRHLEGRLQAARTATAQCLADMGRLSRARAARREKEAAKTPEGRASARKRELDALQDIGTR